MNLRIQAILKLMSILLCATVLTACKLRIVVPAGGHVTTESGAIKCAAGKTCDVDIVDVFFDETFIAVPHNGMYFNGWKKRPRGLFAGSEEPAHLWTSMAVDHEPIMALIESDEIFYLEPIFSDQCTSNCEQSSLKLTQKDRFVFNPRELSWPYNANSTVTANVTGIPQPTTYEIGKYTLEAVGSDFTITNVTAYEMSGLVRPYFQNLGNNTVIREGETLDFSLVSPLTGGRTVQLVFSFKVSETGDTFRNSILFKSN